MMGSEKVKMNAPAEAPKAFMENFLRIHAQEK
jgi:hypothetical protein